MASAEILRPSSPDGLKMTGAVGGFSSQRVRDRMGPCVSAFFSLAS